MLNPDQGEPSKKYLSVPPGFVSADGLRWQHQPVTFNCPGPKPKWVDFHSVVYDAQAPASRRWKAYGCMCPNEPPVRRTICYAYSADGRTWTQHPENPILQPETSSSWDKVHDVGRLHVQGALRDGLPGPETATISTWNWQSAVTASISFASTTANRSLPRARVMRLTGAYSCPPTRWVLEDEIRLYYGAADYRAPDDPPYEFQRWKMCKLQLGLATLPTDGWDVYPKHCRQACGLYHNPADQG